MSAPKQYRTKPVEIEAMRLTRENINEVAEWIEDEWARVGGKYSDTCDYLYIETLEGEMRADIGDYIIHGLVGEFYPCKPDAFAAKYEEVEP